MVEFTLPCERFRQQLRNSLINQALGWRTLKYTRSQYIYTPGERDGMIYYIEKGQVKLQIPSPEGKQCLASIRTAGDIFGEPCLSGQSFRLEMAVAMSESTLKRISAREFIAYMKNNSMTDTLIQYLAGKVSEQLEVINALTTADGEHLLMKTLLYLGGLLGSGDSDAVCIRQRISHEELSSMIGSTRPRVGILLKKFRKLGLVRVTPEKFLVIDQEKMREFLTQDKKNYELKAPELAFSLAAAHP
jgi:CRP/FNR family cyclic AMP-dependent transcriptional regulator